MDNNDRIIETELVPDYINQIFTDIGPNLAKDCRLDWTFSGQVCDQILSNIVTTKDEIIEICKGINVNKSSCIDNVSSEILRDVFLAVPEKLCVFFNNCFTAAAIPDSWKHAKITPLPKGGNDQIVTNYRPISLLPLLSKLIEKIVHKKLYAHLTENHLLDNRQGGFRLGHSTAKTCANFTEDLYKAINNNQTTIAVYIDAMKAFDTVNHQILIRGLILDEHLTYNKHIKEMTKQITHKLYLLSKIRHYITQEASINIFKTMVLSVIEYCDIVYARSSQTNLTKIDKLFYRGLCLDYNNTLSRKILCNECTVAPLTNRRESHLLLFMHKQTSQEHLLKIKTVNTRLQNGIVFQTIKPNNEKAKLSVYYRGAIAWNAMIADTRNMSFNEFKLHQKKCLNLCFKL